jgi:hypothetical protein
VDAALDRQRQGDHHARQRGLQEQEHPPAPAGADWLEEIEWAGPEKLKRDKFKVGYKLVSGLSADRAGQVR